MQTIFCKLSSRLTTLSRIFLPIAARESVVLPKLQPIAYNTITSKCFGILSTSLNINTNYQTLLKPYTPLVNSVCGMKVKGRVKLRCKHCYYVWRQETLYVMCRTRPRHKQMQRKKKPHNYYILTHATQGKVRPW